MAHEVRTLKIKQAVFHQTVFDEEAGRKRIDGSCLEREEVREDREESI